MVIADRKSRGAGRPFVDGSRPGTGEYLKKVTVAVFADQIELAERLGNGNRSAGFRIMADYFVANRGDDNDED